MKMNKVVNISEFIEKNNVFKGESTANNENISLDSSDRYIYQQLSEEEKTIYSKIAQGLLDYDKSISLDCFNNELVEKCFNAVLSDYPEIFWVEKYSCIIIGTKMKFLPDYNMSNKEKESYQKKIDEYVKECLSGIDLDSEDYEKVKYVYEYIIKNTDYEMDVPYNQEICSVMVEHKSVCKGYAKSMQYLLSQLGIWAISIDGMVGDGLHSWNIVEMEGKYYFVDVTWGDAQYEGNDFNYSEVDYKWLGLTYDELTKTHTIDFDYDLPECNSIACNYYVKEGLYLDCFEEDKVENIVKILKDNEYVSVKCHNEKIYNQLFEYLFDENNIYKYLDGESIYYNTFEEKNILDLYTKK